MKGILERATRCPDCGGKVCSIFLRLFMGRWYCPKCGQPCKTNKVTYFITYIIANLVAIFACFDKLGGWFNGYRGPSAAFGVTFFGVGCLMMWIFPFQCDSTRTRTMWAKADVKKVLPYSAGQVFQGLCNMHENRYGYGIEWKDIENMTVCVRKEKRHFVENNEEKIEYITLSVTAKGTGRCELRVGLKDPNSKDYNQRQIVALDDISRRLENHLKQS